MDSDIQVSFVFLKKQKKMKIKILMKIIFSDGEPLQLPVRGINNV
jgi:hypothetical protein